MSGLGIGILVLGVTVLAIVLFAVWPRRGEPAQERPASPAYLKTSGAARDATANAATEVRDARNRAVQETGAAADVAPNSDRATSSQQGGEDAISLAPEVLQRELVRQRDLGMSEEEILNIVYGELEDAGYETEDIIEAFAEGGIRGTADKAFDVTRQNAAMGWMMLTMVEGLVRSGGGIGVMLLNQDKYLFLDKVYAIQVIILLVGLGLDTFFWFVKNFVACPYARITLERR